MSVPLSHTERARAEHSVCQKDQDENILIKTIIDNYQDKYFSRKK